MTPSEKEKVEKDQKEANVAKQNKIYTIVQGVAKNLCLSQVITQFTLYGLNLTPELTSFLSEGLLENKSLVSLTVSNCQITVDAYEILLKGLLTHENIKYLDLSDNGFNDKYANMISRIIARQTQRRDLVIWSFGLRNELPLTNDYTKGLVSLNLSNNDFSDTGADIITNALSYDQYIRSFDLSSNSFSKESCKKFIRMLRKNTAILNFDLKDNPGYDPEIHARMVMKMSKNIQYLNQQVINNQFTIEEFNEMKQFINLSFFNVDIPDEIINMYNSQLSSTQSQQISTSGNNKKNQPVMQGRVTEEEKSSSRKENNQETEQIDDEEYCNESSMNNKTEMSELKNKNKSLMAENIRLKKEFIESRAADIQNSITQKKKESQSEISPQIDNNYNRIVDLLAELTTLMNNVEISLNKDEKKKQPKQNQQHQQQQTNVKKIIEQKDEIIGEEPEEQEQASSRKPEPVVIPTLKENEKQPKKAQKEKDKVEHQSSKKKEVIHEDYNVEDLHYRGNEHDEEYEEEEEGEEFFDEEDMKQNIYQNQYAGQYMMDDEDEEELEEEDNVMNKKINKSF